jgi:hypothetical protein
MVARSVLAALLVAAGAARAQPITRPDQLPCTVRVVVAPDAVRAEIEAWVRAEPKCERELEVRVIPTPEGYYLSARDDAGQMRERIVPDAQSAAVLVVSWMADDSIGPTVADHPVESVLVPAADEESPFVDRPALVRRYGRAARTRHWLTLGALGSEAPGVRGQLDIFEHGRWSAGIAGSWRAGDHDPHMQSDHGTTSASVFVAATHAIGPVTLRAQLGLGFEVRGGDMMMRESVVPALDAAVFATLPLGDRWGIVAGPIVDAPIAEAGRIDIAAFLGVRFGL